MFFESESKAKNFIKWNGDEIDTHGGELRPYYCPACCGWHISSKPHVEQYDHRTEELIGAYNRSNLASKVRLTGVDAAIHSQNASKLVDSIWNTMPCSVKCSENKGDVRKYINDYFSQRGIEENDGGNARKQVYEKWQLYIYNMRYEAAHRN
jgi:hypothetical protein